jgi:hypothetical protein
MTANGGTNPGTNWDETDPGTNGDETNPGTNWDEARIALRQVAYYLNSVDTGDEQYEFSLEGLRGVKNYELIPESVRKTLEDLKPEERQLVKGIFTTLEKNHFYLEGGGGGLEVY